MHNLQTCRAARLRPYMDKKIWRLTSAWDSGCSSAPFLLCLTLDALSSFVLGRSYLWDLKLPCFKKSKKMETLTKVFINIFHESCLRSKSCAGRALGKIPCLLDCKVILSEIWYGSNIFLLFIKTKYQTKLLTQQCLRKLPDISHASYVGMSLRISLLY